MIDAAAFGIMDKIKSISIPEPTIYKREETLSSLTLEHFFLGFIFLFIGLFISTLVFLYELIVNRIAGICYFQSYL